jgi:hypothetical protein
MAIIRKFQDVLEGFEEFMSDVFLPLAREGCCEDDLIYKNLTIEDGICTVEFSYYDGRGTLVEVVRSANILDYQIQDKPTVKQS